MDLLKLKIFKKLSKHDCVLYQNMSPYDDYELEPKLWLSNSQFLTIKSSFHCFSSEPIFSGILFSKSKKKKKTQWFKAKFYDLYTDRLVLFSV